MSDHPENIMELDLEALAANLDYIKQLAGPEKQVIASLKANAYGHDVRLVAGVLQEMQVDMLATGNIEDARSLRKYGVDTPLLLFAYATAENTIDAAKEGFISTIPNLDSAVSLNAISPVQIPVYLKIDCGLGRLGVPLRKARQFVTSVYQLEKLVIEGIYTHVPFPDVASSAWAQERLDRFDEFIQSLNSEGISVPVTQAMASCCVLAGLRDKSSAICVGHALYGLSPFPTDQVPTLGHLRPVIHSLSSTLIHVGRHTKGSDIAVGGLYGTTNAHIVGVLPLGAAMGMRPPTGDKEMVMLVNGKRCPVIAVSLEHTSINLDNMENVAIGNRVTIIGRDGDESLTIEDLAQAWQVTPLQTLMSISGKFSIRSI
jgi:alanine racemase